MISRIIEAKPEELRIFSGGGCGVSKYRDRRRELNFALPIRTTTCYALMTSC